MKKKKKREAVSQKIGFKFKRPVNCEGHIRAEKKKQIVMVVKKM